MTVSEKMQRVRSKGRGEGKRIKCSRGRRSYSRLLSPFHRQLPLCFPEPAPGTHSPLSTSASSTSSSRGVCPPAMPASKASTGATAKSRRPWGVLSQTRSYLTQLYGKIQNNNKTSCCCSASLGALARGQILKPQRGHTLLFLESDKNDPSEGNSVTEQH